MNFGPRKMQISIAAIPAIRTSPIRAALRQRSSATASRPAEREPLTRTASPGSELGGEQLRRLVRVGDQLVGAVVARRLADADSRSRRRGARVLADLAVVSRPRRDRAPPSRRARRPCAAAPSVARWSSAARIDTGLAL